MRYQGTPRMLSQFPLTILGVYIKSDAYPNVKYKIELLLQDKALAAKEINFPLSYIQRLGKRKLIILEAIRWVLAIVQFSYAHIRTVIAASRLDRPRYLYIPYPSIFVLYLLSWLPTRWRPDKIFADVFISIYDTIVEDRRLLSSRNPLAWLLHSIEQRAYRNANVIFADTNFNAQYLSSNFKIDAEKIVTLPLSINEAVYKAQPYIATGGICTVLFIGTFVPLQGAAVIANAIVLLRSYEHIRFRLIGNGQTSEEAAAILDRAECHNVSWERNWLSAPELSKEIQKSDICLGIFGSGEKTQRVWPLKNYAYMAIGRAIITADTQVARSMLANSSDEPFMVVHPGQPEHLAHAIVELANNPKRRSRYAEAANVYYKKYLANTVSLQKLTSILTRQNN
jgi:glycosyltransferase involved in cell wall biosynthesis